MNYIFKGERLIHLNRITRYTWFDVKWKTPLLGAVFMAIGINCHGFIIMKNFTKKRLSEVVIDFRFQL